MSDSAHEPDPSPAPWDSEEENGADAARPARHDAFTPGRRRIFLKHLAKTGCIADAARLTGVGKRTIYNHQAKDEDFARHCELAVRMAGGGIEQVAYERAVRGVPEQFACGGQVYTRMRYSDGLLRLLLQGTNPKKYGPRPGFTRKRIKAWEREEMERDIHRQIAAKQPTFEESMQLLDKRLGPLGIREAQRKRAAGWTEVENGQWVPPGWIRDPDYIAPESGSVGAQTPRDSV